MRFAVSVWPCMGWAYLVVSRTEADTVGQYHGWAASNPQAFLWSDEPDFNLHYIAQCLESLCHELMVEATVPKGWTFAQH